jgi:hypothetical protein
MAPAIEIVTALLAGLRLGAAGCGIVHHGREGFI